MRFVHAAFAAVLAVAASFGATTSPAQAAADASPARVRATVSIAEQKMQVVIEDEAGVEQIITWVVSTGARGYATPTGEYQPTWLSRNHRSRQYNNAPMPFAVFFHNGYAVHATEEIDRLGRPASHGCVRLAPEHARLFFDLVRTVGMENTDIVIVE